MIQIADPKLAKILSRFTSKVDQGDYYEAHQTLRTVVNRYVRSKKWPDAVELITVGVKSFINAGQSAEAADLTLYLLEVYEQGKLKCSEESVARLAQILTAMDAEEPMLKNIVTAINNWSVNYGTHRYGDPSLHAIMGRRLFEAGHVYEAERYLMLGTRESAHKYANLMFEWYVQSQSQKDVGTFFSRLVFNYLGIFNIKYAFEASNVFLKAFIEKEAPRYEKIEKKFASMYYFEDYSELNFLQLLIIACQTKQANYFKSLTGQYSELADVKYKEETKNLGRMYFNIRSKSEANMLGNMMEGFFNNL